MSLETTLLVHRIFNFVLDLTGPEERKETNKKHADHH